MRDPSSEATRAQGEGTERVLSPCGGEGGSLPRPLKAGGAGVDGHIRVHAVTFKEKRV